MILDITVNSLINNYSLDTLKCFERPKLIINEWMCTNAMLYRLLFNDLRYQESFEFDSYMEEKTGVKFVKISEKNDCFHEIVRKNIDNQIPMLLSIDHLYEELWQDFIPNEHEQHTVILKGYNLERKQYLLIDQDYTKLYFSQSNIKQHLYYCDRYTSYEKLYMLATNAYKAFDMDSDYDDKHFVYYYPCYSERKRICLIDEILNDFKQLIEQMYINLAQHIITIKYGIERIICDFDLLLKWDKVDYGYKYIWLNYDGYAVPNEIISLFGRATTLKMFHIFFENRGFLNFHKTKLLEQIQVVRNQYDLCKNLLRKSVFAKNNAPCKRILSYIDLIKENESKLYEIIIEEFKLL